MAPVRHELLLPDLGLGEIPVIACAWLVAEGREVVEGERLLEVVAGNVTVDLPSPASGVLTTTLVAEDDSLSTGQLLAVIESAAEPEAPDQQ